MELDNFEQVAGGFDAAQEPRAVIPQINTGAANNKLIDLRAYADAGSDRIKGMLYVYDANTKEHVAFNAPFRIEKDGKAIGYDGLVSGFTPGSNYRKVFDKMVANKMSNCYVTAIIGNDPGSLNFTNKGPHIINNWDDNVKLPDNFVMLKSEPTPIGWRDNKGGKVHEITVQNNGRLKLRMMGYLMMLRLHNEFPVNVVRIKDGTRGGTNLPPYEGPGGLHYTARRPDLKVTIDLSPTLSAAQKQQVIFSNGSFSSVPTEDEVDPKLKYAFDRTHFEPMFKQRQAAIYRYNLARWKGEIALPVGRPEPTALPAKGDLVVAMYFPQVDDYGTVGFFPTDKLFYDGGSYTRSNPNYTQVKYHALINSTNVLTKSKPTRIGQNTQYQKSLDNKVYYPVIRVTPSDLSSSYGMSKEDFDRYKAWTAKATWTPVRPR